MLPDLELHLWRQDVMLNNQARQPTLSFLEAHVVFENEMSEHGFEFIRREKATGASVLAMAEVKHRWRRSNHLVFERLGLVFTDS